MHFFLLLLGSPLRFSFFLISPSLLAPDKVEQAITFPPCSTIIFIHLSRLSPSPSLLQSLFFSSDYHLPSSPSLANLLFGFTSIIASPLQLLLFFPRPSTFTILYFFILRGISSSASSSPCQETTPPASSLCCAVLLPLASVLQHVTIFFLSSSREQRSSCSVPARPHCWPLICAISL